MAQAFGTVPSLYLDSRRFNFIAAVPIRLMPAAAAASSILGTIFVYSSFYNNNNNNRLVDFKGIYSLNMTLTFF